jgi:hypothetical protein
MARIPWIGLAALVSMFVIPHLPSWIFEGPRTVKHWPRRHICGDCHATWTPGHTCLPADLAAGPLGGSYDAWSRRLISSEPSTARPHEPSRSAVGRPNSLMG